MPFWEKPYIIFFVAADLPTNEKLQQRIDGVLDHTLYERHLNSKDQAAWQIVHGMLSFGRAFQIEHEGKQVPALDWVLGGGSMTGWLMRPGDHGLQSIVEAGTKTGQGHPDQWLGYLSQCGLKPEDPIIWEGKNYHVNDLMTQAQWNIYDGMEATWTLMALSTYLPYDSKWTAKDGSEWTIERIVKMEAEQDINGSACGGTHRLFGLTVALNRYREQTGKKSADLTGGWELADKSIRNAADKARQFQQPDGCLSTGFFQRSGNSAEVATRLHSCGHTLEFLTIALSDDELTQPWVTKAADRLCRILEQTKDMDLECGALYHATHGLVLYRQRRFGPREYGKQSVVAAKPAAVDANGKNAVQRD